MAGGQGTRGRPYTEYFPKAMTPISDRPLIDHIIRYVESFEFVGEIIIITDLTGLGGQILNYYGCDAQKSPSDKMQEPLSIRRPPGCKRRLAFVQDSQSGTGGDLLHLSEMIPDDEPFVLWFADNMCAIDLEGMRRQFLEKKSTACIATRTERAEETGFAVVDENGIVRKFVEKPVMKLPSSECLGMYMLHPSILLRIRRVMQQRTADAAAKAAETISATSETATGIPALKKEHIDGSKIQVNLSHDILQDLSAEGTVSAFDIGPLQWIDVESPAILERNRTRVKTILSEMASVVGASDTT